MKSDKKWRKLVHEYQSLDKKDQPAFHKHMTNIAKREAGQSVLPLRFKLFLSNIKGESNKASRYKKSLAQREQQIEHAKKIQGFLKKKNVIGIETYMNERDADKIISKAHKAKATQQAEKLKRKESWRSFGNALKENPGKTTALGLGLLGGGMLLNSALKGKKEPNT